MKTGVLDFSLDELEEIGGRVFSDKQGGLADRCLAARAKKLCDLTVGELRLLIGQKIGVFHLIPLALELLEKDPLAHESYPGELVLALIDLPRDFWVSNPDYKVRFVELKNLILDVENTLSNEVIPRMSWLDF